MNTFYASEYKAADHFTRSMRVSISENSKGEFVTHLQAIEGDKFWGNYFPDALSAHEDFDKRVKALGVNPAESNFILGESK